MLYLVMFILIPAGLETEGKLQETPPMYEQGITQFPEDNFFVQGMLKQLLHTGLVLIKW